MASDSGAGSEGAVCWRTGAGSAAAAGVTGIPALVAATLSTSTQAPALSATPSSMPTSTSNAAEGRLFVSSGSSESSGTRARDRFESAPEPNGRW